MNLTKLVGKNIKYIRTINIKTQEELAFELEITQSQLSRMEGGTETISLLKIEKISNIFNIEPYILLKNNLEKEIKMKYDIK